MNKAKAKKQKSFQNLTRKERLKNQARSIRQLHRRIDQLEIEIDVKDNALESLKAIIGEQSQVTKKHIATIQKLEMEIASNKKSWWGKVFKR